ncbi:cysteine--tRNA ligase [Psychrobacter aquimaris]|uniref:cysteine--tRNA ligase n=1 Tax=Psychrobacter aquimaris TaxID=292733 RepID=UPI003FD17072
MYSSTNEVKVFNTLTREVEVFIPIVEGKVGIYACGPTVYNFAHIGNLRTYIFEDILRRVFDLKGYDVKHVMNITDVGHLQSDADEGEDKLSLAAIKESRSPWDIAKQYEEAFFRHSELLNIKKPDIICRATEHVDDMIKMIESLIDKGFAYHKNGNVYFDVSRFTEYEKFARLNLSNQQSTDRISLDENKHNQIDFALWFSDSKYPNQIMKWNSPWGYGFPGWHIECSAMSSKYLGSSFDIHCGGTDHIPVHHTNEIAQSDCYHGSKSVNYWMHGAFLTFNQGKMSKSENRFITVDTLIDKGYDPLAFRYLTLNNHYRSELKFSYSSLDSAQSNLDTLRKKVREWKKKSFINQCKSDEAIKDDLAMKFYDQFMESVCNDLHMPFALATMWTMLRESELSTSVRLKLLLDFDQVLGLKLDDIVNRNLTLEDEELIQQRNQYREKREWDKADRIRDELENKGIFIKDTKDGMEWIRL